MNFKHSLAAALLISGLVACSDTPEQIEISEKTSVQEQYEKAKLLLESGSYFPASELLAELDSRYPFGPHSHQVQLDLVYAYYKMGQSAQSLAAIDRFIRLNPTHQNIDYLHYMRGLVNIQMGQNAFQEAFGIERYDRDISTSQDAFEDFKTIVSLYPESQYAADAKQRMIFLKDYMAKTELAVADYYIRRGAFAAAANRAKYVLETFNDSHQMERALEIMVQSYEELEIEPLKQHALETLKLNYPSNPLALTN